MSDSPAPEWAAALGRVPSGLFVLTARHGRDETGMLASWVQQCSFDPPLVSAAVGKGRFLLPWLRPGAALGVNVLPEGEKALVVHFGKGFGPGEPAFAGLAVTRSGDAAPLLDAAHAVLDCRVAAVVEAGDHFLVLAQVIAGRVQSQARPATHVRRTGTHY